MKSMLFFMAPVGGIFPQEQYKQLDDIMGIMFVRNPETLKKTKERPIQLNKSVN